MAREKNEKGTGSFRTKPNGSLEYRFSYRDEIGALCRRSVSGATKDECIKKAEKFLYYMEKKAEGIDLEATIPDLLHERYDGDLDKNYTGEQGYSRNIANLSIIEKSFIGNIPIYEISEQHLDLFLKQLTRYSNSVIGKVHAQLKTAFSIAIDKEIIYKNLMNSRDLRCPKSKKPTKEVHGFTEDEQSLFLKALEEYRVPQNRNNYKLQLYIELYSGLRMGEINALRANDIDLKHKVIHVQSTVSRGLEFREFIKTGAKTYTGVRDVPINKMLEPFLEKALEEKGENPYGLVFYDYNKDDIIATHQVNSFYRRLCQKGGLNYYGQHSLRHTFATRCIEADIPAVVLKSWLGHKDIHVTLDTYADVFDRMNFKAMEKLEEHVHNFEEKLEEVQNNEPRKAIKKEKEPIKRK